MLGAVYIGEPKPGERYRLILTADGFGVHVKLPGTVAADPDTVDRTANGSTPGDQRDGRRDWRHPFGHRTTGAATTHDSILRSWRVGVAPTVLFFGKGAREVAPRLAGASIPDFYGSYLDDRLRTALRSLG